MQQTLKTDKKYSHHGNNERKSHVEMVENNMRMSGWHLMANVIKFMHSKMHS